MPSTHVPFDRAADPDWWRGAVFYQVYIRSFADGNGDGVGDLIGLGERLPYLCELGVDALWITPFYVSPMVDHGYDVADPRDVDPSFGALRDFDALVARAHELGLAVTVDLVPNHVSAQHEWFLEALADTPNSPSRARFHFRPGRGANGHEPPNNWRSTFGGPAWTRLPDGDWYLHLFAPEQPDLDWTHPDVAADLARTMRFWLDRGADGFRIDVAHGMAKPEGLPDSEVEGWRLDQNDAVLDKNQDTPKDPRFDDPGVHDIHRGIRRVLDAYPGAMAVGEIWVEDDVSFRRYIRPDELHLGFHFGLLEADWSTAGLRAAVDLSLATVREGDTPPCWVLSNHDRPRHRSRYDDPGAADGPAGARRARAAALLLLGLPGVAYLYYGEELGQPDVWLPEDALQDPVWERSGHTERGRDQARVPMPWAGEHPPYGFGAGRTSWLPMPEGWAALTVAAQAADPGSMLTLYRAALAARPRIAGRDRTLTWLDAPPGVLAWRGAPGATGVLNLSGAAIALPPGEVLLASGPLEGDRLPPDTAAWLV